MRIFKWFGALTLVIGLSACTGLSSSSATLYEFEGREWIVVTEHSFTGSGGLLGTTQKTRVAVRNPDGSFRVVGTFARSDTEGASDTRDIDPEFGAEYTPGSATPVLDLREMIHSRGQITGTVDTGRITQDSTSISFPESAVRAFVEPEERDDMY